MNHLKTFFIALLLSPYCFCQDLNSNDLLNKSISYHDPNNQWPSFNGEFTVVMETPNNSDRTSKIKIDLPKESFHLVTQRDSSTVTYILNKGKCIISKADSLRISKSTEKPKRSHCEMAELYKNYYTYLYGLPMKLKDPGTILSDKIERKTFKGKAYLSFKVSYDANVCSDVWQFYFNPSTYALEAYQFYKTKADGQIKPESGEYIVLSAEAVVNGIKMPKIRAWYYNKDDNYLGTDILK